MIAYRAEVAVEGRVGTTVAVAVGVAGAGAGVEVTVGVRLGTGVGRVVGEGNGVCVDRLVAPGGRVGAGVGSASGSSRVTGTMRSVRATVS